MKRRRPREHVRRVRTRFGRKRLLINRGITGRVRRKTVQGNLKVFLINQEKRRQADANIEQLRTEYVQTYGSKGLPDDFLKFEERRPKFKSSTIQPQGSLLTRKEKKDYTRIISTARRKGYAIPKLDLIKGPFVLDEVNIPETSETEAFVLPDKDAITGEDTYLVMLDDDATKNDKKKALAHELGHIHMYEKKVKPHTELKADEIAAHILNTSVKDIQQTKHLRDNVSRMKNLNGSDT